MEGSRKCMNAACGAALAIGERKKGWGLKSGGFAELCNSCGAAFERLDFCGIYHSHETGWRECSSCGKRLHCGCIVSKSSMELLDSGGVQCISCTKAVEHSLISTDYLRQPNSRSPIEENATTLPISKEANTFQLQSIAADGNICDDFISKIIDMNRSTKVNGQNSSNGSVAHVEPELVMLSVGNPGPSSFPNINQALQGLSGDRNKYLADDVVSKKPPQPSLITLGTSNQQHSGGAFYKSGNFHTAVPISSTIAEGKELNKMPPVQQQMQRGRHLLPKPPKVNHSSGSEAANDILSHVRAVRPPVEGRGRTQLLPRYWPRITEEELQKMTGESPNSTVVPLFEKVLSASDAGRIGRLVLPKACAEAYFPPISQPEGLPLTIQDVKGKNWVFQFRFWPNNNSRMYVLEGVTPCIQSLQLQAGDTVTFSRIDPEGKLVMGFRKATNSVPLQDSQISAIANGLAGNENILSGASENLPIVSGYPGLHQSLKENADSQSNDFSELGQKPNKHGSSSAEELQKRCGYGGSKSKRLHIDHEDAMELKLTWEEAQDLLRPPLSSKPSIVMIDDHEFEEYDEPPVLGKRTIFTVQTSGIYDQWAQCDNCFKWRRLPADVLLTSKWTCAENKWDLKRSCCSAPTEISPTDLQNLVQQNADLRRRRVIETQKSSSPQQESSGLDALATVAALGEDTSPSSPVAKTTKHPRHRPGCTCIVCIQPPSGKGPKHKPDCVCNVCITVRRRFNTLMMRKKKKQTEQEEAALHKNLAWVNNDEAAEASELPKVSMSSEAQSESNSGYDKTTSEELVKSNEHLNVNFHPMQENNLVGLSYTIMSSHLEESDHASQSFRKADVSANLSEQVVLRSSTSLQLPANKEGFTPEQNFLAMTQDQGSSPEGAPSNKP